MNVSVGDGFPVVGVIRIESSLLSKFEDKIFLILSREPIPFEPRALLRLQRSILCVV